MEGQNHKATYIIDLILKLKFQKIKKNDLLVLKERQSHWDRKWSTVTETLNNVR